MQIFIKIQNRRFTYVTMTCSTAYLCYRSLKACYWAGKYSHTHTHTHTHPWAENIQTHPTGDIGNPAVNAR